MEYVLVIGADNFYELNYDDLNLANTIYFDKYFRMNDEQKQLFLTYKFESLINLDLCNQNIDDEFVKKLCESGMLNMLKKIDLSNNEKITSLSIQYLFESENVTCEGKWLEISGKYDRPMVTIQIVAYNTNVQQNDIQLFIEPNFDHTYFSYKWQERYITIKELKIDA
jgi:hypothetical protein